MPRKQPNPQPSTPIQPMAVPNSVPDAKGPYTETGARLIKTGGKDGDLQLSNFTARIVNETHYHDGDATQVYFDIVGKLQANPTTIEPLPEISIPAKDFGSLAWVSDKWGSRPVIFPQPNAVADLRTAIQLYSTPNRKHIYTFTGWTDHNGSPTYMTHSGGINAQGLDRTIRVQLPNELKRYALPEPTRDIPAISASLHLSTLARPDQTWPLIIAAYRAAIGDADFAVHLAGRTGTFKSEFTSLIQSHWGAGMDARHLPASWNSTQNAIEGLAHKAKDAIMVLDDFVPTGTAYNIRQLQAKADSVIRAQGNQSGRSRLTDTANIGTTMYPRGIILSTGEDIPEGHSVRGRMLILELAPGDIAPDKLREAQKERTQLPHAMAQWIHWLAKGPHHKQRFARLSEQYRDEHIGTGHTRTPAILGQLLATVDLMHTWLTEIDAYDEKTRSQFLGYATAGIIEAGSTQLSHIESADPVTAFCDTIQMMLQTGQAHVRTTGGGAPTAAYLYGWVEQKTAGEMPTWKTQGPRLGWVSTDKRELYIDPNIMPLIRKNSGGKLTTTQTTLVKRLAEGGVIARRESNRERNTIRITAEGHGQTVMALDLAKIIPQIDDDPTEE